MICNESFMLYLLVTILSFECVVVYIIGSLQTSLHVQWAEKNMQGLMHHFLTQIAERNKQNQYFG